MPRWRRRLLLLGGYLDGYLQAEVLLVGAVERLEVADPQRIERRVRSEFRRPRLAAQGVRVADTNVKALVQRIPAGPDHHGNRRRVVVDRKALTAGNRVRR